MKRTLLTFLILAATLVAPGLVHAGDYLWFKDGSDQFLVSDTHPLPVTMQIEITSVTVSEPLEITAPTLAVHVENAVTVKTTDLEPLATFRIALWDTANTAATACTETSTTLTGLTPTAFYRVATDKDVYLNWGATATTDSTPLYQRSDAALVALDEDLQCVVPSGGDTANVRVTPMFTE